MSKPIKVVFVVVVFVNKLRSKTFLKKNQVQKNIDKKNVYPEKFLIKTKFGIKKILNLKFFVKKCLGQKSKKKLGTKKIFVQKMFGLKRSLVQKKCWLTKIKTPKNWVPKAWSKLG